MWLCSEGFQIERLMVIRYLIPQRCEACEIYLARPQKKPSGDSTISSWSPGCAPNASSTCAGNVTCRFDVILTSMFSFLTLMLFQVRLHSQCKWQRRGVRGCHSRVGGNLQGGGCVMVRQNQDFQDYEDFQD